MSTAPIIFDIAYKAADIHIVAVVTPIIGDIAVCSIEVVVCIIQVGIERIAQSVYRAGIKI